MTIRDISGSGKGNYGEHIKRDFVIIDNKNMEKEIKKALDETKVTIRKRLSKTEDNKMWFDMIKRAIYSKNKEAQKEGWTVYHSLSPAEQKAFKAEIRAEEAKAHKAKKSK